MKYFLILLFAWVIHGQAPPPQGVEPPPPIFEIPRSEFQLNSTITDPTNYVHKTPCNGPEDNCPEYKKELCQLILNTIPQNLTKLRYPDISDACSATPLTSLTDHTMDWNIKLFLVTNTSTGPLITFICPTFGELLTYLLATFEQPIFKDINYEPRPIPFDPSTATDVEFRVNAYLCNSLLQPVTEKFFRDFNDTYLMEVLQSLKSSTVGDLLFGNADVSLRELTKTVMGDRMFVSFELLYLKVYIQKLRINPYCDMANILQMSLTGASTGRNIVLCGVTVQSPIVPTEMPVTTTGLASTTTVRMKTLVYALVLSQIVANI